MPKDINVHLKFNTDTTAAKEALNKMRENINTYTTTTGTAPYNDNYNDNTSTTSRPSENYTYPQPDYNQHCWHRLPCGDCAITMRPCHHGGWNWKLEWTCKSED